MRERWKQFRGTTIVVQHSSLLKCNDHSAVGGNVNWCSHYGELYGASLKEKKKNLKIELPYTLAIPLLGIYLEKIVIQKDTYTSQDMEAT